MNSIDEWYKVKNSEDVISPSLLVYPDRVKKNIELMVSMAGGTADLRPHIKTHKIAEIVELQMGYGIDKFKCATVAEMELLAKCGAPDILLAMQPVGINVVRFFNLLEQYPNSLFSTLVDNLASIKEMADLAEAKQVTVSIWLDINNGMNRTGVRPGNEAIEMYKSIDASPFLNARGLHVYDGHIHESDFEQRKIRCESDFEPVLKLKSDLESSGIKVERIVAGGTPTFPIHLTRKNVETSPGTPLLWDQGYAEMFPDLNFLSAAVLLTRVVSQPETGLVCFDLGHKSVASEMNLPRVKFLGGSAARQISQSEEHLVVETNEIEKFNIGSVHYAVPFHVCPTVAKYKNARLVNNGETNDAWEVAARDHEDLD